DVRYICATNKTKEELKDPKIFRQDLYYRLNVIPLIIPPLRERKEDILLISDFYIQLFNKRYNRKIVMTKDAEKLLLKNKWEGNIRELKNVIERLVILSPHENIYSEQLERILTLGNIDNIDHVDNLYSGENNEELSRNSNIGFERAGENIEINDIYGDEGERNAEADEFATDFGERILSRINNSENITIDLAHQIIEEELLKNALCKFGNISDASKSLGINPSTVYRKIKKGYINLD
ncbi:helix-turn-helix domain-containing protein, partial [Peptostreptococcus porci]